MKVKPGRDVGGVAIELGMTEAAMPGVEARTATAASIFKLKRILVPVDFSERSTKALRYAAAFARQFDAELTLLHVVQRYPQVPELAPLAIEPVEEVQRQLEEVGEPLQESV